MWNMVLLHYFRERRAEDLRDVGSSISRKQHSEDKEVSGCKKIKSESKAYSLQGYKRG